MNKTVLIAIFFMFAMQAVAVSAEDLEECAPPQTCSQQQDHKKAQSKRTKVRNPSASEGDSKRDQQRDISGDKKRKKESESSDRDDKEGEERLRELENLVK